MRFSQNKIEESSFYVEYFEGGKTLTLKNLEPAARGRKRDQMQMIRAGELVGVRYQVKAANDNF